MEVNVFILTYTVEQRKPIVVSEWHSEYVRKKSQTTERDQTSQPVEVYLSSFLFFTRQTSGNRMLSIFTQSCSSGVRAAESLARTEAQRFSRASEAFSADNFDKQEDKATIQAGKRFVGFKWPGIKVLVEAIGNASFVPFLSPSMRDGAPNETLRIAG